MANFELSELAKIDLQDRSVFRSHAIYFQIDGDDVLIIGIIRSQDPARLR